MKTYGVVYQDVETHLDYVMYITAENEEDAINIPVFRGGKWTPLFVFRMPSGPGSTAAERLRTVGTQQWVVE